MKNYLWDDLFSIPVSPKPRAIRQTWLKDLGFLDSVWGSRIGLAELPDFLEAMSARLDYVKFLPDQASISRRDWFVRKVETYLRYGVVPYFDHGFFNLARNAGKLEDGIVAARELGVPAMEFWNVAAPYSASRWAELVRFATANDLEVIFEYHPAHMFDPATGLALKVHSAPATAIDADEILRTAMPSLDAGATRLMVDHKTFDCLGERAGDVLGKLVDVLGLARTIFEADSEKHLEHLEAYFKLVGPDANVANVLPGQAPVVDVLRSRA